MNFARQLYKIAELIQEQVSEPVLSEDEATFIKEPRTIGITEDEVQKYIIDRLNVREIFKTLRLETAYIGQDFFDEVLKNYLKLELGFLDSKTKLSSALHDPHISNIIKEILVEEEYQNLLENVPKEEIEIEAGELFKDFEQKSLAPGADAALIFRNALLLAAIPYLRKIPHEKELLELWDTNIEEEDKSLISAREILDLIQDYKAIYNDFRLFFEKDYNRIQTELEAVVKEIPDSLKKWRLQDLLAQIEFLSTSRSGGFSG